MDSSKKLKISKEQIEKEQSPEECRFPFSLYDLCNPRPVMVLNSLDPFILNLELF